MKKTIVLKYILLLFLLIACKKNENIIVGTDIQLKSTERKSTNNEIIPIQGKWEWKYNPNNEDVPDMLFTLLIQKSNGNEFIAQYCAIDEKGNRIDCSNEKEYNVNGIIKGNKIEATFYSFFDSKKTEANVELLILNKDSIQWQITKKVNSELYVPTKCILTKKNKKISKSSLLNKNKLPFDFDEYEKLGDKTIYNVYNPDDLPEITKIINDQLNEYPVRIFSIDNEGLAFETFVFETDGDSVTQIIVNIKGNKVLSKEIVGYESDSKNTFKIKKDLSIEMYKIDNEKKIKTLTKTFQIDKNGSIVKGV
ncbi:hypothetical protein B0A81_06310 [Flavobacterium plurextorum]|uniref:Lipocalin-like domain-containing protein n=1 Tax=Flavobacterium plurextorum TaxID=1114867 RepID=A0ABX4CWP8_9FLAO|nr:hypothetical protein [Flavobacterium plurextorum]OXB09380.1 hypothetical protein B0A81_06310 [Flavobacterium plurextorum]